MNLIYKSKLIINNNLIERLSSSNNDNSNTI